MHSIFCCSDVHPYKNITLSHESKFNDFLSWAAYPKESDASIGTALESNPLYAVQVVKQVNYGPLESKRYFTRNTGTGDFTEVIEKRLIDANFQKLNAYKNFKCSVHNRFFEVNIYQLDPINKHHWRANVARPASEIDL